MCDTKDGTDLLDLCLLDQRAMTSGHEDADILCQICGHIRQLHRRIQLGLQLALNRAQLVLIANRQWKDPLFNGHGITTRCRDVELEATPVEVIHGHRSVRSLVAGIKVLEEIR